MSQEILGIIWSAVGIVVTGLVSWGVGVFIQFLNSKIKNEKIRKFATQLTTIISGAVQAISQQFVDTLKKQGKFDAQAQAEVKEKALEIIKGQLTTELKDYVSENFGDLEKYLQEQIEAVLYQLKNK